MDSGPIIAWVKSTFAWVDLLPICLVLLACWQLKKSPAGCFFESPLNRRQGQALRGIFACVVVLFHLSSDSGFLFPRFQYWFNLPVAVFLGLSGYGLASQLLERDNYLSVFWKQRLRALLLPYLLFLILELFQGLRGDFAWATRLRPELGIVSNGWYCVVLLLFYAWFWLGNRWHAPDWKCGLPVVCALVACQTAIFVQMPSWPHHFLSNGAFVAGLILGHESDTIWRVLKKHAAPVFVVLCAIVVFHTSANLYFNYVDPYSKLLFRFIVNAMFFVCVAAMGLKVQFGNRVLDWLGAISYELYLGHGWVRCEIRHWWPELEGAGYVYAVVAGSLIVAGVVHGCVGTLKQCLDNRCPRKARGD